MDRFRVGRGSPPQVVLLAAAIVVMIPTLVSAQSITGTVRDSSGAVLPGVSVEAASPALIEKVRTAVSDGAGQYRIENLTPGVYRITYALPGFVTVERAGVEVTTGVTLTLNADMRLGGVQETITVTGETPVVDVQNSTRVQRVLSDEVLAALPASRGYGNLLTTVSGIQANGTQNGGVNPGMIFFTSRGGRSNEGTVQIDGMNVGSAFNGGGVAGYGYDTTNAQEVQLTVAGGLGEADRGGPQFNIVPKTGGNNFSGTFFGSLAGEWSRATTSMMC
jgi:Carboxypeptidase regulatory-like domain